MFDLFDDCQTFDALVACADGGAFDTFTDDDTIADDRYFTDSDGVLILIDSNVPTVGTFGKIRLGNQCAIYCLPFREQSMIFAAVQGS
jgi:hypothetical protein